MKKQITRISPLQTAKVMAVLYLVISVPLILLMSLAMLIGPGPRPPFFSGALIIMPLVYALAGFAFSLAGAWIYNLVAGWIGGIEVTVSDVSEA